MGFLSFYFQFQWILFQAQCHTVQKIVLQNFKNICLKKGVLAHCPTISKVAVLSFLSSVLRALIYLIPVMRDNDRKHWKVVSWKVYSSY